MFTMLCPLVIPKYISTISTIEETRGYGLLQNYATNRLQDNALFPVPEMES